MKRAAEVTENPTTSTKKAKLDNVSSVIPSSQSPTRQSSSTSSSSSSSSTVSSTLPKNVTLPMNSVIEVQWYVSKTCSIHTVHKFFWLCTKIKSTNFICFFSLFFPFTVCFVLFFILYILGTFTIPCRLKLSVHGSKQVTWVLTTEHHVIQ